MIRAALLLATAAVVGCSDDGSPPVAPPPPPAPADAAADGITAIGSYDPASGMHVDEPGGGRIAPQKPKARTARTIDIMLRSTPPGARASVGGVVIGDTPALWSGEPTGEPMDFTFVLSGHAVARYRFIPIASGLVHARLEPIAVDPPRDGGLGPEIAPTFAPDAAVAPTTPPPAPPAPPDAAPVVEPAPPPAQP